jgi:hypothetical protein
VFICCLGSKELRHAHDYSFDEWSARALHERDSALVELDVTAFVILTEVSRSRFKAVTVTGSLCSPVRI